MKYYKNKYRKNICVLFFVAFVFVFVFVFAVLVLIVGSNSVNFETVSFY